MITIRSSSKNCSCFLRTLINRLDGTETDESIIRTATYRSADVETDFSILIQRVSNEVCGGKSLLGRSLAELLLEWGLVNHTVGVAEDGLSSVCNKRPANGEAPKKR